MARVRTGGEWRRSEVIAWTRHDGAPTPPRGPGRVGPLTLAGALAVVLVGITWNDTLCPEHRSWVYLLAGIAFTGAIVAIVGLIQGWAVAPMFTVLVALTGMAVGLIDAVHEPAAGRLVALGFGACAVLGALISARAVPLALWERRVRRGLVSAPVPQDAPPADAAMPPETSDAGARADAEDAPQSLG